MGRNIGLIGRARSGKDTAGRWLVDHGGYERVAFADPLKEAALRLNPVAVTDDDMIGIPGERLAALVRNDGWERAKDWYPEVRRILQELGAAMRGLDEDFWLRLALEKTIDANRASSPVVITDVRYPNEAESLRRVGFHLVYIERPSVPQLDHESERLTEDAADSVIVNDGDLTDFKGAIRRLFSQLNTEAE